MKILVGKVQYTVVQKYTTKDGKRHTRKVKKTKEVKKLSKTPGLSRIRVGGFPSRRKGPYVRPYKSYAQKRIDAFAARR